MKVIDEVLAQIEEHRYARSSEVLAHALVSACTRTDGPSLLSVSASLDDRNFRLFCRLARITHERDYSNTAQANAVRALDRLFSTEDVR